MISDADADDDALIEAIAKRLKPIIPAFTIDVWFGPKAIEADTKKNVSTKLKRLLAWKMAKNQIKSNDDVNKKIEEEGGGEQTVAEAIKISTEKVFKTYDSRLRQIEQVQKKQFCLNCSGQELVGR